MNKTQRKQLFLYEKIINKKTEPIKLFKTYDDSKYNSNINILYLNYEITDISNMTQLVLLNNIRNYIIKLSQYSKSLNKIEEYRMIYFLEVYYYYMYIILYLDCETNNISNMRKFVLLNNIRNHINYIRRTIIELSKILQ
jgi:hypothetical protein